MNTGTKLANNPNYGRPSARKLAARMAGWRAWAAGMTLLRQIHVEIADKLQAKSDAETMLQNSTVHAKSEHALA